MGAGAGVFEIGGTPDFVLGGQAAADKGHRVRPGREPRRAVISPRALEPQVFEQYRLLISEEPFLMIEGVVQNIDRVTHVKARRIALAELRRRAVR